MAANVLLSFHVACRKLATEMRACNSPESPKIETTPSSLTQAAMSREV